MGVGRKPVPTALKLIRGNPGKRPINDREPALPAAIPEAPGHLGEIARAEWDRLCRVLAPSRMLTEADRAGLSMICTLWEQHVLASEKIKLSGLAFNKDGWPCLNPLIKASTQAIEQMRKLLTEFGCTPAARSRIAVPSPSEDRRDTNFFAS